MQIMPTNDVFHHLILLLRIHKDKELLLQLFADGGVEGVTKSKLKAWSTKTRNESASDNQGQNRGYREMPREALDGFIAALYVHVESQ